MIAAQPGIADVRPYTKEESARLLEPWLGAGLSLDDLPVPRVIVAQLSPGTRARSRRSAAADRAGGAVGQRRRSSRLDRADALDDRRHRGGRPRHPGLVIARPSLGVVRHARRDGGNRPIVEVLHFVGASDRYIASHFQRHFLRLGLEGGVIGGGLAMLVFGSSESIASWFSGTPVGDQFAALLGTFSLRPTGYLAVAAQALLIAAITGWASRRTLFATLRRSTEPRLSRGRDRRRARVSRSAGLQFAKKL